MFLPPIYSVAILMGVILLYILIRYLHHAPLLQSQGEVPGWFSRQIARAWAFRTWVVNAVGGVLIAAPDITVALIAVDLTPLIGTDWSKKVGAGMLIYNAINGALKTKPVGVPAA